MYRWCKWVDEITSIDYEKILLTHGKREGKMKEAITKLTASKDVIGAVRCGLHDQVREMLDKDVRIKWSNSIFAEKCLVFERLKPLKRIIGAYCMRE